MRLFRRLLIGLVLIVATLAAALYLVAINVDVSAFAETIARRASLSLGRSVEVNGAIEVVVFPRAGITAHDVVVRDSNANAAALQFKIGRLEAVVSPVALIFGDLDLQSVRLVDVDAWLDALKRAPGSRGGGRFRVGVPQIAVEDLRLHWRTKTTAARALVERFEARLSSAGRLQGPIEARIEGGRDPIEIAGSLSLDPKVGISLSGATIRSAGVVARGNLSVDLASEIPSVSGEMTIDELTTPNWCSGTTNNIGELNLDQSLSLLNPPGWNIALDLRVGRLTTIGQQLADLDLELRAENRSVVIFARNREHIFRLSLFTENGAQTGELEARGKGMPPGLACLAGDDPQRGVAAYGINLRSQGSTYREIAEHLTGTIEAKLGNFRLGELNLDDLVLNFSEGQVKQLRSHGHWQQAPLLINGSAGTVVDLINGTTALDIEASVTDGQVSFSGSASRSMQLSGRLQGAFDLATQDGPIKATLHGDLAHDKSTWSLRAIRGSLADSAFSGEIALVRSGEEPKLSGTIEMETLDLAVLRRLNSPQSSNLPRAFGIQLSGSARSVRGLPYAVSDLRFDVRSAGATPNDWHIPLNFDSNDARWQGTIDVAGRGSQSDIGFSFSTDRYHDPGQVELTGVAVAGNIRTQPPPKPLVVSSIHGAVDSLSIAVKGSSETIDARDLVVVYSPLDGLEVKTDALTVMDQVAPATLDIFPDRTKNTWSTKARVDFPMVSLEATADLEKLGTAIPRHWKLRAWGDDVHEFAPWAQTLGIGQGQFNLTGHAAFGDSIIEVDDVELDLESTGVVRGKLVLSTTTQPTALTAELFSPGIELSPVIDRRSAQSAGLIPELTLPGALPDGGPIEVTLNLEKLTIAGRPWREVELHTKQRPDHLSVRLGAKDARTSGSLEFNIEAGEPKRNSLRWTGKLVADNVDAGALLPRHGLSKSPALWPAKVRIAIDGRGTSLKEMLLSGTGTVHFSGGETDRGAEDLKRWETNMLALLFSDPESAARQKLHCVVIDSRLEDGGLSIGAFLLDAEYVALAGGGRIDLDSETIDLRLAPRVKQRTPLDAEGTIRLVGPILDPEISVDASGIVMTAGKAVLGFVNPLFLVGSFVPYELGSPVACESALQRLGNTKAAQPSSKVQQPSGLGGILRAPLEGIKALGGALAPPPAKPE